MLLISAAGAFVALLHQALARPHGYGDPVLLLGLQALQLALAMLMARAALSFDAGEPFVLGKLGPQLKGYFTFFATTLICEMVVMFGLLLLVAPGFYWATRYCFAPLLALDRGLDPFEAMTESGRITEGVRWQVFGFGWALIALNLAGAIALGIGLLFTLPVTMIALVHVMRRLQTHAPARVTHFTEVASH